MGIQKITDYCISTDAGDLVFYIIKPTNISVGNSELLQISREKSRKTEEVFQVGSRRAGGKSKSIRARFLLEKQKKMLKGSHKFLI